MPLFIARFSIPGKYSCNGWYRWNIPNLLLYDDLTKGVIKVVMTASSTDSLVMQKHRTTKSQRKALSDRMKDPAESQERAVEMFIEKLEVVRQLFFEENRTREAILAAEPAAYYGNYPGTGFNYRRFFSALPKEKLSIEIIQELIELAREIRAGDQRGVKLGLSEDELAFYDALETNDSAVQVLGDEN